MSDQPPRRFTLLDGMVLIAATALGFGAARTVWYSLTAWWNPWTTICEAITAVGLPLTFGVFGLFWRGPRPETRELALRPGFAACLAVGVPVAWRTFEVACWLISDAFLHGDHGPIDWSLPGVLTYWLNSILSEASQHGTYVATVWFVLILGGHWKADRSWVDYAGRALGMFWIVLLVTITLRFAFAD
jgi:hypothetical protein